MPRRADTLELPLLGEVRHPYKKFSSRVGNLTTLKSPCSVEEIGIVCSHRFHEDPRHADARKGRDAGGVGSPPLLTALRGSECGNQEKERTCSFRATGAYRTVHPSHPRSESHAGCRLGRPLRCRNQGFPASRQEEHRALPCGFHVQAHETRIRRLEVTNCDLKLGRQALSNASVLVNLSVVTSMCRNDGRNPLSSVAKLPIYALRKTRYCLIV